jgi:hypothetical protein
MKSISRTITVLICVYLVAGSFALAMETAKESAPGEFSPWQSDGRHDPVQFGVEAIDSGALETTFDDSILQGEPVDPPTVVVIPTAESIEQSPELIETAAKDLNIMCRIFEKELGLSGRTVTTVGDYYLLSDALGRALGPYNVGQPGQSPTSGEKTRQTRSIYLEGYGAVFFVKVGFPLTPPPQMEGPDKETEADVDPVWRQAEQELYEPLKLKLRREAVSAAEKYDEAKVESLKQKLIRTLKHSANIRSLKPDEQLIVTACGPQLTSGRAKVLSIRAKKSDIDAFAKDKVDLNQFRKKVQILVY